MLPLLSVLSALVLVTCSAEESGPRNGAADPDAGPGDASSGGTGGVHTGGRAGRGGSGNGGRSGSANGGASGSGNGGGSGSANGRASGSGNGGGSGSANGGNGGGTSCGNGSTEPPEECDTGSESATCNADCTLARCGDGKVNASAKEECDVPGGSPGCDADCTYAVCGDGIVHSAAGETCDERGVASATCDADCTAPSCGDGITNAEAGEQCDDGNNSGPGDGCGADCRFEPSGGAGDTCGTAIPLSLGANTVTWSATTRNYMKWTPACVYDPINNVDIVLSYKATFTGVLDVNFANPINKWIALVNDGPCGDASVPLACIPHRASTMSDSLLVTTGRTYYFYIGDSTSGSVTTLANPLTITLSQGSNGTGENCGTSIDLSLGKNVVNWTASARDVFFNNPSCVTGNLVSEPDIALSFRSAFEGWLKFDIAKPASASWVVDARYETCGNAVTSNCQVDSKGTSLSGLVSVGGRVSAGSTNSYRYFILASHGTVPLDNPITITLTGMDSTGTGEACVVPMPVTLGTNTVLVHPSTNDYMTTAPACTGGKAISGGDMVLVYKAPTAGTLNITVNKAAASGWSAVVTNACGDLSTPMACLYDFANTKMSGKLPVIADGTYYIHLGATGEGAPLTAPLDVTLSQ
jgi:cysteine-rich repeat protein